MLIFLRRTAGVLAALLTCVLAVAAAACAFLALATVTPSLPVLYAAAAMVCLLTAFLLGRLAVRLPTRRAAAWFALAVTALSAAGAWALVLRPWPVPSAADRKSVV